MTHSHPSLFGTQKRSLVGTLEKKENRAGRWRHREALAQSPRCASLERKRRAGGAIGGGGRRSASPETPAGPAAVARTRTNGPEHLGRRRHGAGGVGRRGAGSRAEPVSRGRLVPVPRGRPLLWPPAGLPRAASRPESPWPPTPGLSPIRGHPLVNQSLQGG